MSLQKQAAGASFLTGTKIIMEIISCSKNHSAHFTYIRSMDIINKLGKISLLIGLLIIALSPLDFIFIKNQVALWASILPKIFIGVFFIVLYLISNEVRYNLGNMQVLLVSFYFLSVLFYISNVAISDFLNLKIPLIFYIAWPVFMVSLGGLFPLTLIECISLSSLYALGFVAFPLIIGVLEVNSLVEGVGWHHMITVFILCNVIAASNLFQLSTFLFLHGQGHNDELTGIQNRRSIMKYLSMEIEKTHFKNQELSIALLDLDFFKQVNDKYGHAAGDCVLKHFAEFLTRTSRGSDIVGRYGGEEFLIILPGAGVEGAAIFMRRLLSDLRNESVEVILPDSSKRHIKYTVSAGVSVWNEGETPEDIISRSDSYLYISKDNGRNCALLNGESLLRIR